MPTLTECAFAELRPHLAELLRLPLESVRPATQLSLYLPLSQRRQFRKQLATATGLRIPELRYRSPGRIGSWVFAVTAVASGALAVGSGWLAFALPIAVLAGGVAKSLTDAAGRLFISDEEHPAITTLGDLAQWTLARNMKTCRKRFGMNANHDEILTTIRAMLLEQMEVDPRRVTEDFCFAELE